MTTEDELHIEDQFGVYEVRTNIYARCAAPGELCAGPRGHLWYRLPKGFPGGDGIVCADCAHGPEGLIGLAVAMAEWAVRHQNRNLK